MGLLHGRGVRGYVTLNTLIFPAELPGVETLVRRVAEAGVDAVIVQDLGLARLIRALTPDLEIHASTQMSVTSVEGVRMARDLGCSRVILARELSVGEIAAIAKGAVLPVEVFVHGALCVAYSGQCLTSEALGGRSANRGECAQACRMAYDIVCDGRHVDLGDIRYLLSPQDLAAFDLVPKLVEIGVASLKIEGRLKAPEYVAGITRAYRRAIDSAVAGRDAGFSEGDVRDMEMTFSRGFSHGFLDGNDHKVLVRGDYAKKRGVFLGTVEAVVGPRVRLTLAGPIKPGDGVVFDGSERDGVAEQGGRVYEVVRPGRNGGAPVAEGLSAGPAELGFGRRDLDLRAVRVGQRVWKTDDPDLTRRLRQSFENGPHRLVDLAIRVEAEAGRPLRLVGRTASGRIAEVDSGEELLPVASRLPATAESLRDGLDRLGGTVFRLSECSATLSGGPMVPKSLLNRLRRELVAALEAMAATPSPRFLAEGPVLPGLRASLAGPSVVEEVVDLSALCRTIEQAEAAVSAGVRSIYLDFQDIRAYREAVASLRKADPGRGSSWRPLGSRNLARRRSSGSFRGRGRPACSSEMPEGSSIAPGGACRSWPISR